MGLGLLFWPFILVYERDFANRVAALESRPEDMTRNILRSLKIGYRRRMKVSAWEGRSHLAGLLFAAALTLGGWTVFAVELLDNI